MTTDLFRHHKFLQKVADEDVAFVLKKDRSYGASWKLSGGRSAWFMLRRKIDRMMSMMARPVAPDGMHEAMMNLPMREENGRRMYVLTTEMVDHMCATVASEDIFQAIERGPLGDDGTVLAEVRDLRRYLLLVEAEMVARGVVADPTAPERAIPRRAEGDAWDTRPGHE